MRPPSITACAATGRSQPPPTAARNARSAATHRCDGSWSIAARRDCVVASPARHSIADRALAHLRQHRVDRHDLGDRVGAFEPFERRDRHDDRVERAIGAECACEPGLDVAAQLAETKVGPQRAELRSADAPNRCPRCRRRESRRGAHRRARRAHRRARVRTRARAPAVCRTAGPWRCARRCRRARRAPPAALPSRTRRYRRASGSARHAVRRPSSTRRPARRRCPARRAASGPRARPASAPAGSHASRYGAPPPVEPRVSGRRAGRDRTAS